MSLSDYPKFIEPLLDNLETLITARYVSTSTALGHTLPAWAMVSNSRRIDVEYPFLAIIPGRSQTPEGADGGVRQETLTVLFEVAITDADPKTATRKALRAMRTLDAVICSATVAEMFANYSTALHGPAYWQVLEHTPLVMRRLERTVNDDQQYLLVSQLIAEFKITEKTSYA